MKKIILVAGGTGGHFFPAVALGEELVKRGYEVHFITDLRCKKYIKQDMKVIFHILDLKRSGNIFLFLPRLSIAVLKAIRLLYNIRSSAIIGFGGYPVIAPMFAAIFLRVPIIIHEQNFYLGKVNKFFASFTKKIAISYEEIKNLPEFAKSKIVVTGGVVRENIRDIMSPRGLTTGSSGFIKDFLDPVVKPRGDKPSTDNIFTIFIFGGSQGAKLFSELIPASIQILMQKQPGLELNIIQQAALDDQVKIKDIYSKLNINYEFAEFFENMALQYKEADLVISRAGASTIEELTYIGLPAIFIPLPSAADNHQYYNAKLLEDKKAGWCLEQNNISAGKLADKILDLISNPKILEDASQNLLKRRKEGHKLLSNLIEEVI
ncbi:UDP-N-acetylglucosamine--N-acetylmuramyl-(pentapeptide) pyrophosphoryl-undecaprenol N-acetylglucosamine transferase [Rickettsia monacensis]|uniref:UDP-N-acetylglucosamine--N-acetylmuramyl-(pentapeptide) pyrophosphoryl-undecaprenol N-acetylglucosamine transferase n=1 Tax=Rickettsia monacensis TaxID=109232 RepID=A0A0B7J002_9RICK|nr:undecaprenyldiphospho-muramoylpentapeptide beta-N-acetylglucosaminyltransferase [Rickettsia monacensis]CDI29551.1 UDP-N-acetylglucosamine--N-acetylmuramyl-(pentapeptide) pyrophosphoryl-undecaprenol N-acetylglucosamine transferase [Rickettsia monacensis IrR/Munich]CEO17391.1 UDP-N-acetylglucosamine--N-acetylmuramyl-(pentapeptide) pyrophosphoryl-undecaprenol N-acetylglucosamine transferase [Rickettsia monacensis]